jgi:hypothetical protein
MAAGQHAARLAESERAPGALAGVISKAWLEDICGESYSQLIRFVRARRGAGIISGGKTETRSVTVAAGNALDQRFFGRLIE